MILDFLSASFLWVKAFHVISVIAWMAGLFYLPRLFVYHTEQITAGSDTDALFQTMERKLYRLIMNPAMIAAWVFGLLMVITPGVIDWTAVWSYAKLGSVGAMTWFHHWLGRRRKDFVAESNSRTGRDYRIMNEVPTLLLLVIVVSVIVKPF